MVEHFSRLIPHSRVGTWSVVLIIVMPILFVIGSSLADTLYAGVSAGGDIISDIASRPALALTMLAGMVAGIASCITGLIAIIRWDERSLLVYLSTFLGSGLVLFLLAELFSPH